MRNPPFIQITVTETFNSYQVTVGEDSPGPKERPGPDFIAHGENLDAASAASVVATGLRQWEEHKASGASVELSGGDHHIPPADPSQP